uniref:Uncharacterized protein n=1 Tax=Ditylenchus dipsaci TaxID=166011 RepID=A0A915CXJ4_9BILA
MCGTDIFWLKDWFSYSETELVNRTSIVDEKIVGELLRSVIPMCFLENSKSRSTREKPFHQSCWSSIDPCSFFKSSLAGAGNGCPTSFKDEMNTYEDKI